MDKIELGKKFKEARERMNYTQERLAEDLKPSISIKTLQRAEKGSEEVTKETLIRIAEFLSIEFSDDGYIAIPELPSISQLIKDMKNYDYDFAERDNFETEELEAILDFVTAIEKPANNFKEEIAKEIEMRKCYSILEEKGIKIYVRIKEDATIIDNRGSNYGIYKEDYKNVQIYLFKKSSKRVIKKKDGKTYIEVIDDNYLNLREERAFYGIYTPEKYPYLFTDDEKAEYPDYSDQEIPEDDFPF